MTTRDTPENPAGGGNPAGQLPGGAALEAAAVLAAAHRRAGADPMGAYRAALAGIVLIAVPAFERALKEDVRARWETRWRGQRRAADLRRRERWLNGLPVAWRVRLRAAAAHSDAQLSAAIGRKGNKARHTTDALVLALADVWERITGQAAYRRNPGDGVMSEGETFIALAVDGLRAKYRGMSAGMDAGRAVERLQAITPNAIAERLKPRKHKAFPGL